MEKYYKWLLALGVLLYLVISVSSFHPDLKAFVLANKFISHGEVFSFYDHISKLPQGDAIKQNFGDDIFIYPPLAYLIPSVVYLPFNSLLSNSADKFILSNGSTFGDSSLFLPLLIFKLPFLIFAFLTLYFIPQLFNDPKKGKIAQIIWLFAPVTIFVSSGLGQADTILTFFILMSLISIKNDKLTMAAVFVALSALIKPFGLILLPLIALKSYKDKGFVASIKTIFPSLLVWLAFIAPYLGSPAFKMYALLASLTSKTSYAGVAISGGTTIPWLYIFYLLIVIYLYLGKLRLIDSIGLTILSTLAFTHFHPQWFLWLLPWLIYYSVSTKKYFVVLGLLICWTIIWLSFDASLSAGLFISLKNTFTATDFSPLKNSPIELVARAGLLSVLFWKIIK
jgi:hypothetical protein